MGQIDTFDPKAKGESKGTPKKAGSLYDSIPTAVRGVRVCEHLPQTADLMDRVTAVRTVNHKVIDEHASATNLVHTGRHDQRQRRPTRRSARSSPTSAAPRRPDVPAYMLIGYPNVSRGPGFLGAKAGYVYLTDTDRRPGRLHPPRRRRRRARRRRAAEAARSRSAGKARRGRPSPTTRRRRPRRCGSPGRRSCKHFDLNDRAGDAPRALRRRVRPALPARPPAGRRPGCGSSRCRTT